MLIYSAITIFVAVIFFILSIAIYNGRTDLIHDYHQTKVKDKTAYGKAFGKVLLIFSSALLTSGIVGFFGHNDKIISVAVAILLAGLCIGFACLYAVQKKYNNGLF